MIRPTDPIMYPMESVDIQCRLRSRIRLTQIIHRFFVAFIATPDPTGLLSIVVGLICSVGSDDGTGITVSEEAIISLFVVEELN